MDDVLTVEDIIDSGCTEGTRTIIGIFDSNNIPTVLDGLKAADQGQVILTDISACSLATSDPSPQVWR